MRSTPASSWMKTIDERRTQKDSGDTAMMTVSIPELAIALFLTFLAGYALGLLAHKNIWEKP